MKKKKRTFAFIIGGISILLIITGVLSYSKFSNKTNEKKEQNSDTINYEDIKNIAKTLDGYADNNMEIKDSDNLYIVEFRNKETNKLEKIYHVSKKNKKVISGGIVEDKNDKMYGNGK